MNKTSGISTRKDKVLEILNQRDFSLLMKWARSSRNPIRVLTSFQFDTDPLTCMRAVEALGVVAKLYKDNLETLRRMIRRFFWNMNDESGNVGWYSAEAIGETLRNVPELISEYAGMLPAYLIEEPFEKGTRIAIARIAEIDKSQFDKPVCKKLIQTLHDPNPDIRGSSIVALKALCPDEAADHVTALSNDSAKIELYDFDIGVIKNHHIKQLAQDF